MSFFDRHWWRGEAWYRGQFPLRSGGQLVGEASPSYLFHPLAPERARSLVPDAKLVALLRDPGGPRLLALPARGRAGARAALVEDALAAEEERTRGEVERLVADPRAFSRAWWDHTYVARGRYAEQLERWFAVFPREQLLVATTEELGERPAETYASVLSFLGAEPHALADYPRVFDRDYAPMRPETRAMLAEWFAEPNRRLEALLGRELSWISRGRCPTSVGHFVVVRGGLKSDTATPRGLRLARGLPDVDVALGRVAVDLRQLVVAEVESLERPQVRVELLDARGTDERGGHPGVAQRPRERHRGQRLATPRGDLR